MAEDKPKRSKIKVALSQPADVVKIKLIDGQKLAIAIAVSEIGMSVE
jgi:hypothetical protein